MDTIDVFNFKISSCIECPFFRTYNDANGIIHYCTYTSEQVQLKHSNDLYENCPFIKPLFIKDFEEFGFKEIIKNTKKDKYYLNKDKYDLIYDKLTKDCYILLYAYDEVIFDGKITSKPHLEFILKTLKII